MPELETYRAPTDIEEVWLHVDEPDDPSGRVWAVQYYNQRGRLVYATTRRVFLYAPGGTTRVYPGPQQPRLIVRWRYARVHRVFGMIRIMPWPWTWN